MTAIVRAVRAIPLNPVLARELKERMRGRRAMVIMTVYLALLAATLYLVYETQAGSDAGAFGQPVATEIAGVGRLIFEWLVFFMLLLVLFLVPGFTSAAIAGERERQTLVPLQVTLLRPVSIVLGKIWASLAFLALLVVAALPLLSVSYLIGGVSLLQVLQAAAAILATGVVLACFTVLASTLVRRVQAATVVAYAITLALTIGTLIVYGAAALVDESRGIDRANPPAELLLLNPIVAASDLLGPGANTGFGTGSPFDWAKEILLRDRNESVDFVNVGFAIEERAVFAQPGGQVPIGFDQNGNPVFDDSDRAIAFWLESYLVLGLLSVLAVLVAARRLRTPAREER